VREARGDAIDQAWLVLVGMNDAVVVDSTGTMAPASFKEPTKEPDLTRRSGCDTNKASKS
jgi:hypothetical protein